MLGMTKSIVKHKISRRAANGIILPHNRVARVPVPGMSAQRYSSFGEESFGEELIVP